MASKNTMSSSIIIKKSTVPSTAPIETSMVTPKRPRIPGLFPASQFGEQVVSTGIPSLDGYLGGGILLGSILVIKDEYPSRYGDLILKSFLAEGASYNHYLYVAAGQISSSKFANELPSIKKEKNVLDSASSTKTKNETSSLPYSEAQSGNMKIAWRYKDITEFPTLTSSRGSIVRGQKQAKFEFTKRCSVADLGGKHLFVSKLESTDDFNVPTSAALLHEIATQAAPFSFLQTESKSDSTKISNNILRLGISHLESQVLDIKFLMGLRSIVRYTNSCAVLTISSLCSPPRLLAQLEELADTVIKLEPILDEKQKIEVGDVDCLCKVERLRSLNSLKLSVPPTDLGFSYKHKRLTFQELHLAPEGEQTVQREIGHHHINQQAVQTSCGTTLLKGKSIDF